MVVTGPNGAGKTNLLEAISFLAPGRGLRNAVLTAVDRREPGGDGTGAGAPRAWAVAARVAGPRGPVEIGTGRDPLGSEGGRARRLVKIDGAFARGQTALSAALSVTWLTPQMDRMFLDGATERRRFIDRLVYGFDPAHAARVSAYEHALRERARLLRGEGPGSGDATWLDAVEDQIAAHGVAIVAARRDLAARLAGAMSDGVGPFPRAGVRMEGAIERQLEGRPALAVEDEFRDRLAASRAQDAAQGGTRWGPHRDDLTVTHLATDTPAAECSTGEQKALLISLVLAQARVQTAAHGEPPLLLLDEVVAHLDARRREALFEEIVALRAQAWLTGTDEAMFAPLRASAQFLRVRDAVIAHRPAFG